MRSPVIRYISIIICLFLWNFSSIAQSKTDSTTTFLEEETVVKNKGIGRPTTAGLLSLALPGAGQVYNKKYWKAPIIWGLSGFFIYNIITYNKNYQSYKKEAYLRDYQNKYDPNGDSLIISFNPNYTRLTDSQVKFERDDYQRSRDMNTILFGVMYFLNVIDAVVDAHLTDFDVSENAVLSVNPWTNYNIGYGMQGSAVGIGLTLRYKK